MESERAIGAVDASRRPYGGNGDGDLVANLKSGLPGSAEVFVRCYSGPLLAIAKRLVSDNALAEDCVQDTFMKAFQKIGEFEERCSLMTWMHRIVVNQALMKLRRRRAKNEISIDKLLPSFDETGHRIAPALRCNDTPQDIVERLSLSDIVQNRIHQLPADYRVVLQLRDIEGWSTREVARALDLTEANVKIRLYRARIALKYMLEPLWKEALR